MKPPRWIVPLESGQVAPGRPHIDVWVTDLEVMVQRYDGGNPVPLCPLPSLAACQLGQMLEAASAWCGQERARREARRGPR